MRRRCNHRDSWLNNSGLTTSCHGVGRPTQRHRRLSHWSGDLLWWTSIGTGNTMQNHSHCNTGLRIPPSTTYPPPFDLLPTELLRTAAGATAEFNLALPLFEGVGMVMEGVGMTGGVVLGPGPGPGFLGDGACVWFRDWLEAAWACGVSA